MVESIGIIGAGEIAAAMVDGLRDVAVDTPAIFLSPRNAKTADELAARHRAVQVCEDNQSVIDQAELVLLAVRPDVVRDVLEPLDVPGDRVLVSAVAAWSVEELNALLDNEVTVVRAIPLPAVRQRRGITALYPGHPVVEELFNQLGGTVVAPRPEILDAFSAATASISTHLHYLDTVARWMTRQGVAPDAAERYVRTMFSGVEAALDDYGTSLADLGQAHETPGGINEQLRSTWFTSGNQAGLEQALEDIRQRVARPPAG
jgi:pyrroline-5-carboxylate reductase